MPCPYGQSGEFLFGFSGNKNKTKIIQVFGLVQGVGFRPFIYRLAHRFKLTGYVINTNECVEIKVSGGIDEIKNFISAIENDAPQNAKYFEIKSFNAKKEDFKDFLILESRDKSSFITEISPDMAKLPRMSRRHEESGKQDRLSIRQLHELRSEIQHHHSLAL